MSGSANPNGDLTPPDDGTIQPQILPERNNAPTQLYPQNDIIPDQPAVNTVQPGLTPSAIRQIINKLPAGQVIKASVTPQQTDNLLKNVSQNNESTASSEPAAGHVFEVQLAAGDDESHAIAKWLKLQSQYADILTGLPVAIKKAETTNGNNFYRIRVGAFDNKTAAQTLCSKLQTHAIECFVSSS